MHSKLTLHACLFSNFSEIDRLKPDVTKKLISQELKPTLPTCKNTGKLQIQELVKIIRTRVKVKYLNMNLFYKLLLNIKLWYICWFLQIKILNKPSIIISQHHKPAKTMLFDWRTLDFHHSIFPRWETDQVIGASFMFSSVIKDGQILPIGSAHFGFFFADFHWDMSENFINIYNKLQYCSSEKKLLQIALLGTYLGKN